MGSQSVLTRALLFVVVVMAAALLSAFVVAPDQIRLSRSKDASTPLPNALFSHWAHDDLQCWACHPSVFPTEAPITHDRMKQGLACGACHDGKRARKVGAMSCGGCHVR